MRLTYCFKNDICKTKAIDTININRDKECILKNSSLITIIVPIVMNVGMLKYKFSRRSVLPSNPLNLNVFTLFAICFSCSVLHPQTGGGNAAKRGAPDRRLQLRQASGAPILFGSFSCRPFVPHTNALPALHPSVAIAACGTRAMSQCATAQASRSCGASTSGAAGSFR